MSTVPTADPAPMVPRSFHVLSRRRETADTVTIALASAQGGSSFAFAPGQFNMLYMFGLGEVPISVSGNPAAPERLVHTIRSVGRVSAALAGLRRGGVVGVRGPFGAGWPVDEAAGGDVVIVAGGLGLAPLRPAIYQVLSNRRRFGRVSLLYGARSPAEILYRHELERWRRRLDIDIEVTVDHATDDWRGNVGVVPGIIARAGFDPERAVAMVCGPEVMMRFTIAALHDRGVAADRIYLSMERNMKCAVGLCGHCQFGPSFVCKDGPVVCYDRIASILQVREI